METASGDAVSIQFIQPHVPLKILTFCVVTSTEIMDAAFQRPIS